MRIGLVAAAFLAVLAGRAVAAERPSFLIPGETFCTDGIDFGDMMRTGRLAGRAQESCSTITGVTRVVVKDGGPGRALVWIASGPLLGTVGWTNGHLPQ
jgi:hypothetical protein